MHVLYLSHASVVVWLTPEISLHNVIVEAYMVSHQSSAPWSRDHFLSQRETAEGWHLRLRRQQTRKE